jgi:hypothetical protein
MLRKSILILFVLALALHSFQSSAAAKDNPIFSDNFESGNFNAWDAKKTDLGDLAVTASAALEGARGMRVRIDDNTPIYVIDDTPSDELRYKAKFHFDPHSISMANGDSHTIFLGQDQRAGFVDALRVQFRKVASGYRLRAGAREDNLTWVNTAWFAITDQSHEIEVEWEAAESEGIANGQLSFFIDSVKKIDIFAIDNGTFRVDRVRLGAVSGIDTGTRGVYFFDSFESFN